MKPIYLSVLALTLVAAIARAADPTTAPPPRPLMQDFIGLNTHTVKFKPDLYAPVCKLLRDYHPIDWDFGDDTSTPTQFPFAANRVHWGNLYGDWTKAHFEIDACLMFDSIPPAKWKDPAANAQSYGQSFAQFFGPSSKTPLVTSVEIGNEPAKYSEPQYREIFTAMSKGLRAGDPKLKIATCAVMTGKPDEWSKPMSAIAGLESAYDILNIHSYPFKDHWPTWRRSFPEDPTINFLKEIQSVAKWRNENAKGKQVWLTEFGYDSSTKTPPKTGNFKDWQGVTDLQQAQFTVRAFLTLSAMDVDRAYLYFFNDDDQPQLHGASGITRNFKPKPAFYAIAHLYKTLGHYQFSKIITQSNDLYCYEYQNPQTPSEKIYVAWSPTTNQYPRTTTLPLSKESAAAIHQSQSMPTTPDAPAQVPYKQTPQGLELQITESPTYLFAK